MSTIKVNKIENTNTADGGVAIDSSGHVQVDGVQMPTAGAFGNRNLVINGAMEVAQRGTSQASVSSGSNDDYQTLDRFGLKFANSAGGVCTVSQNTDVPSNEGFSSSYKVDVTTADTSVDANHMIYVYQKIEAQNVRNSGWNYTTTSSYVTLSFWVKSSKAGTYVFAARANDAGAVYYVFEYTLTANTWTKVTHSIPGNSSLVFNNDNDVGFDLRWYLAVGTNRDNATANQWNPDNSQNAATSNQVNFFDSTSNDFYLTGVQLEVGEKSTAFQHLSYGDELAKSQRYFYRIGGNTTDQTALGVAYCYSPTNGDEHVRTIIHFPVTMRSDPSMSASGILGLAAGSNQLTSNSNSTLDESVYSAMIDIGFTSSSLANFNAVVVRLENTATAHMSFDAEL